MTLDEAARQFIHSRRRIRQLKAIEEAAAAKLKAHFRKTKRSEFAGVGYAKTTQQQLDTAAVKELLGEKLSAFQKSVTRETLSILEGATT